MAPSLAKNAGANKLLAKPKPAFIVDSMLGSVARKLQFFGFDTWYGDNLSDAEIIRIGTEQKRVILTCDRTMYRKAVRLRAGGTLLRGLGDLENIAQTFLSYGTLLSAFMHVRPRCPECNSMTIEVARSDLKQDIRCCYAYSQFFQCSGCGKIYWEGSHYKSLTALSKRIDGRILELIKEPSSYIDHAPVPRLDFVPWGICTDL